MTLPPISPTHVATASNRRALRETELPYLTVRFTPVVLSAILGRSWIDDQGQVLTVDSVSWDDRGMAHVAVRSRRPTHRGKRARQAVEEVVAAT